VLTRDAAIEVLTSITVAPITRTIRGIRSGVRVGEDQGLPEDCVLTCDNVITIPQESLDPSPTGELDGVLTVALDHALRFALDIRY
jgi:mRNA interferase MazF